MAGTHYVTAADGVGWILSKPTHNRLLALTRLSLENGESVTALLDGEAEYTPQVPVLAADGDGHLWFMHGRQILRIDEDGGAIRRWDLPQPAADASPSDEDWGAGAAGGNAWDPHTNSLLFVRVSDHRLYRFDPGSGTFDTVADLPMITHSLSRVSQGPDGSIAINGAHREGNAYSRAAVVIPAAGGEPQLLMGILSICVGPLGSLTLDEAGSVRLGDRLLGAVEFTPYTDVPFNCDADGNAFTVGRVISLDGSEAHIAVYRFSSDGGVSTATLPLTFLPGTNPHDGSPMNTWSGPSQETLLPDGQGGVWLVNMDGTIDIPEMDDSPFSTLMRIRF